jgi:hypothetical protein
MIVLGGLADAPGLVARREAGLVTAALPDQPYHAAAGLELAAAEELIGQGERGAEEAAVAGLLRGGQQPARGYRHHRCRRRGQGCVGAGKDRGRHALARLDACCRGRVLPGGGPCRCPAVRMGSSCGLSSLPAAEQHLSEIGRAAGRP